MSVELVNAQCPNCSATLRVDPVRQMAVCEYCRASFMTSEAIKIYNTYIQNVQHINAQNVYINNGGEIEKNQMLHSGEVYLQQFREYKKAEEAYRAVVDKFPDEYRGWLGLAKSITEDLKKVDIDEARFRQYSDYANKALIVAPPQEKASLRSLLDGYVSAREAFLRQKKTDLSSMQGQGSALQNEINIRHDRINGLMAQKHELQIKVNKSRGSVNIILLIFLHIYYLIYLGIIRIRRAVYENRLREVNEAIQREQAELSPMERQLRDLNSEIYSINNRYGI